MKIKKKYLNIFLQVIIFLLIVKILILDNPDLEKLIFLNSKNVFYLFLFVMSVKLLVTLLFYFILNIISLKKNSFLNTSSIFLQGGIVNQLLPGVGFVFKYYRLKQDANINLAQFSISQTIWTLNALSAYIFLGLILGILIISLNMINLIFFLTIIFIFIFSTYLLRQKIYSFVLNRLKKLKRTASLIQDLEKIKEIIKMKFYFFPLIFLGFIFFSSLQCCAFFICIGIFGIEMSFIQSSGIFITSTLAQILTIVNFFGLFELIVTAAASFVVSNLSEMFIFSFGFRIIDISSTLSVVILISIINLIKKYLR